MRHHRDDVVAARLALQRLVAVLDRLRVVLDLVIELRQHLVALRQLRIRHEARRRGFGHGLLGARVVLLLQQRETGPLVDRERLVLRLRLDRVSLGESRERLVPVLGVEGLLRGAQWLGHLGADLRRALRDGNRRDAAMRRWTSSCRQPPSQPPGSSSLFSLLTSRADQEAHLHTLYRQAAVSRTRSARSTRRLHRRRPATGGRRRAGRPLDAPARGCST